jgi:thioredoxin reductase (NADPH)
MAKVIVTGGAAAYAIRDFLTRASVDFEYLDGVGPPGVAVCRFPDGTTLERPTLEQVAERLGLLRCASLDVYDLAVVGAGPAGLAAAVYAASEGLSTVVVEREAPGGQAGTSAKIENYLGFPDGITGAALADRARAQATRFGAEILVLRAVVRGEPEDDLFASHLSDGSTVRSRCVLCTTGVEWRRLETAGVDRLLHAGVYYGSAASEAPGVKDKDVFIVGGGNSSGQAAMNFAERARSVTLVVRGAQLASSMSSYLARRIDEASKVSVRANAELVDVDGDDWLRAITLRDRLTGREERLAAHAVFICIGGRPRTEWAGRAGVLTDPAGYLVTGRDLLDPSLGGGPGAWPIERDPYPLETGQPGLFAAGDVRHGSTKRVSAAVGEGAMAVALIHRFLSGGR